MFAALPALANHSGGHTQPQGPAKIRFAADFPELKDHEWGFRIGGFGGITPNAPRRHVPLILIHGNNVDHADWYPARDDFKKAGWTDQELWALSYNGLGAENGSALLTPNPERDQEHIELGWNGSANVTSNEINVADVYDFIVAVRAYTGSPRFSIAAHSLGVTLARRTLKLHPELRDDLVAFVGIAGGNHGTSFCPEGSQAQLNSCDEIAAGTAWLADLNGLDGSDETYAPVSWLTVYDGSGAGDPAFAGPGYAQSPALKGADNRQFAGTYHNDLRLDPAIVKVYREFIEAAEAASPVAAAALPSGSRWIGALPPLAIFLTALLVVLRQCLGLRALLAAAFALLTACSSSEPAATSALGGLSAHRFESSSCPARDYYVYTPPNLPAGPRPLVVYLHGCTQSAQQAIDGVRWNELADREGIVVAYPEQADFTQSGAGVDGNGSRCWNWFLPQGQTRDSGEACAIAGITREVIAANPIDPARVYIAGISAGGVETSNLGATYPELYAALGVVAGGPYTGADVSGALTVQAMGERARRMPVLVFHGVTDTLDVFPLGLAAVRGWLNANDRIDDGMANQSVPTMPATTETFAADEKPTGKPRGGDTCVRNMNFPCAGGALGYQYHYPYTVEHYLDGAGESLLDFWQIQGLAHNYAGGDPKGTFVDPLGPDTTEVLWDFFKLHPMPPRN